MALPQYSGGHELRAAFQALAGQAPDQPPASPSPRPSGNAGSPWFIPPHLLRQPALRESALQAHDWALQASKQPGDFESVYHYGLALQELAARLASTPADQLSLLEQACEVYGAAARLQPGAHSALYNWGVALSDMARIVRPQQPQEAYACLQEAASKYVAALDANPANPQALNNWGLVLQDLAALRPRTERGHFLQRSLSKFRLAIRMWPEFDRACYNLGTVLYAHACALQEELVAAHEDLELEDDSPSTPADSHHPHQLRPGPPAAHAEAERAVRATFAHAGQYIALAYALQPSKQVYADSLAAVQRLLPLPYLRAGSLLAVHPKTQGTPAEQWVQCWFGVDGAGLRTVRPPASEAAGGASLSQPHLSFELGDITDAVTCLDPSLPAGFGIWLGLASQPLGAFLVCSDLEDAEGWVDAIKLLLHIQSGGRTGAGAAPGPRQAALAQVFSARPPRRGTGGAVA